MLINAFMYYDTDAVSEHMSVGFVRTTVAFVMKWMGAAVFGWDRRGCVLWLLLCIVWRSYRYGSPLIGGVMPVLFWTNHFFLHVQ